MLEETFSNVTFPGGAENLEKRQFHWIFIVLEVTFDVVIITGDVCLLFLYFTRKLLGQSTNILVFSVAVGDLITAIVTIPLDILQKFVNDLSPYLCKSYFYFSNVARTAISYSILMLAMERIMAALNHKVRLLSPGRCLFFTSLSWFFAASYNIWSLVLYSTEYYDFNTTPPTRVALCFVSESFMYLYQIFLVLDFLIIFLFPSIGTFGLFVIFVTRNRNAYQPGRPYKPSLSVIVFTFALFVCFVACHLPLEIISFLIDHRAASFLTNDASAYKVLQMFSFTRGFWDLFIFGAFRHYVCRKEKALAQMRDQRSKQQCLSLDIPQQAFSTSLLDSDQEVSARNSHSSGDSRQ
ncbi:uncharacterized protein LOC124263298 [Haliotis rubra]|uniref:uncharacterized protein LOC124263298 n=1 Tax=Haliotis rubra TaxID=36100 RepID=UPI001EE57D20|nr:uncharacterized protein LOC124263298 [Haliotis rubra]